MPDGAVAALDVDVEAGADGEAAVEVKTPCSSTLLMPLFHLDKDEPPLA